ncbi:MAG TPA: nucleotide exchange factor GrpE [Verrucomicrobiae bacterium]
MNNVSEWKVAKLPFIVAWVVLTLPAVAVGCKVLPSNQEYIYLGGGLLGLGAVLGCLPFILEYRAIKKLVEVNAVTSVTEQLHDLKKYAAQVAAATDQWAQVQETTKNHSEKTVTGAREIADRMAEEIREFNEFQTKLNDTEKAALRLEVDKLRRSEGEWLQVVARILDHVFALNTAAVRSGQAELAENIGSFQNACHDSARRVGLVPFGAQPGEAFDPQKHRAHGGENAAPGAPIAGLLAPGFTFQGRQIRPALVQLATAAPAVSTAEAATTETATESAPASSAEVTATVTENAATPEAPEATEEPAEAAPRPTPGELPLG